MSVEEIRSDSTKRLIEQMRDTMRKPQVSVSQLHKLVSRSQLAVIEDRSDYLKDISSEQLAEQQRAPVDFHVIINPKLTIVGEAIVNSLKGV